jgi:predicted RNA binding protein YcfA (HicA-like mRNA interferase family)
MRIPRDLGGDELIVLLRKYGYSITRQTGSHIRLTTQQGGEHHVTIPRHNLLRIGTLNSIVKDVADHLGMSRDELATSLFGK